MRKSLFRFLSVFLFIFVAYFLAGTDVGAKEAGGHDLSKLFGEYDFNSTETTGVIVELEEKSLVQAKHFGQAQNQEKLSRTRKQVISEVIRKIPEAKVGREFDYLFSGFSLEIPEAEVLALLGVSGINAVYPDVCYAVPELEVEILDEAEPSMQMSNPHVGAPEAWSMGYTGEGTVVAVIDTGVDYTHPELAHAFGDYKGYDFVDLDEDPMDGGYHGTHVAGTIAAMSFGIAPDAQMLAYRVLGPAGGTASQVIAGIEQAVMDGAGVMNLSLGNAINSPDYATSIALDWAMAEGVVAVTSSGNEGPAFWSVGSPGASRAAITVGSTALPQIDYRLAFYTSPGMDYPSLKVMGTPDYRDVLELDGKTFEFEYVGLGRVEEFASVDVRGKIALIQRGEISFAEKSQNAKDNGAVAAVIFNNTAGEINALGDFPLPTFQLTFEDGYKLYMELMNGNNSITVSAEADFYPEMLSDFSSRGPAFGTWMIKPDLVAPGDWILSTYPGGAYVYAGGTSMASPHVAAAALLVLQAHPEYTPEEVKAALMNNAERLMDPLTGDYYLHNEQGAGSLRIKEALVSETLVLPGSFSFGIFEKNKGKQVEGGKFEIKNLSAVDKQYSFKVEFFGNSKGIKLTTSNNLKIKAGSSKKINYNVQIDASKLSPGFYRGLITVSDGVREIYIPTILFVQEPDYPRVSLAGVMQISENEFIPYAYVNAGAEYLEIAFYGFDPLTGRITDYLGYYDYAYNVGPGFYEFPVWDGTVNDYRLPPGLYVIVAYAEYKGRSDLVAYLFEII